MGRALSWSRHAALARSTAAPTTAHGDGLRRPQAPPVSSTPEVEEYLEGPWQPWWAPVHDVVRNWMGSSTWECAGTPVSRFWSHHLAAIGACTFIAIASVSAASSQVGVKFGCRSLFNDVSPLLPLYPRIADQVDAQVKVVGLVPGRDSCIAAKSILTRSSRGRGQEATVGW